MTVALSNRFSACSHSRSLRCAREKSTKALVHSTVLHPVERQRRVDIHQRVVTHPRVEQVHRVVDLVHPDRAPLGREARTSAPALVAERYVALHGYYA